jgi:Thioesterase superfamily
MPALPADHVATADFELRYEDVAQDGRMMVTALPPAIGWTVWRQLLVHHPARQVQKHGIVPILTRLTVDGTDAAIRVDRPVEATGGYQLARHAPGGDPARLFMNMWVEVRGAGGRIVPPTPAGPPVVAGRVFAEHTFTKLFAPPDQRRVTRLDVEGLPEPFVDYAFGGAATAMDLPDGATALDDGYLPDAAEVCFGLDHTDSNQHVNSLVYPRLFAEAALRRLAGHGRSRALLVRHLDIAYRKPSFAGDRVRVHLRGFALGDRVGAAGVLIGDGEPPDRPRCAARILLA